MGGYLHLLHLNRDTADSVTLGRFKGGEKNEKWKKGETDPNPGGLYGRRKLNNVTRLCCDWREGTRLMRFKRRRLFNSAHLFKDILGENQDFFIFPLLLFYPHFPATWCFHFLYFKCCQRGMCFLVFGFLSFFLVVYIYILRWGLKKNLWHFVENKSWTLSWCICKTTMYVQYACKCRCPGVATVHLTPPHSAPPFETHGKLKKFAHSQ